MTTTRSLPVLSALLLVATTSRAQTSYVEIEPNDSKAAANVLASCLVPGDQLSGSTVGAASTAGADSVDLYLIATCPAPLGIYEHTLTLATSGPTGFVGSLRGLGQTNGVIQPGTDFDLQSSSATSAPLFTNKWYGFGRGEQLYYRVAGTPSTTAGYVATYNGATQVVPTPIAGTFAPGSITITTHGVGHLTDTDLWVYDATLHPIPLYGNDDLISAADPLTSRLTRTFAAGTYYLALSTYNLANDQAAAVDDNNPFGRVTDFPDIVLNGVGSGAATSTLLINFSITAAGGSPVVVNVTHDAPFVVKWFRFTVGDPVSAAFCAGDGSLADHTTPCPCGNSSTLPGNGCAHSFDPAGANLTATGQPATNDVVLVTSFTPSSSFTLFMQHDSPGDTIFHDGVLCAGGALIRLRGRSAVAGSASFPNSAFANDATLTLSQRGQVFPGQGVRRYYAAWYRNASTTFCPPATSNVTNGWRIDW